MLKWFKFIRLFNTIFRHEYPNLDLIQKQGLLSVKIGQTFALRIDFLGEKTCNHLSELYSRTIPIAAEDVQGLLKSYTSDAWIDQFEWIDDTPIGSASVGQVHKAKLKTGELVAVKFIKKDFRKSFEKDVRSLRRFAKFIIFFYPKLRKVADPIGIIEHIESYTLDELDLRKEVEHGKVLRSIYETHKGTYDLSRLRFPKIYEDLSSESILVSEFLEGPTVDTLIEKQALPYNDLLEIFHIHGFFIFFVGTFHGDLHPGNIIYKDNYFYFIDTGALSTVGKKIQNGLFEFMEHLSYYDFPKCALGLNHMAEKEISGKAYDKYYDKFMTLYNDFEGRTVSEISLTKKMMQTIKLGVLSGMEFEKGMFPIIKSMMYLDGMVLKGAPNTNLMVAMRPYLKEFNEMKGD
jgi:ubiquinone biosynthesis protein